MFEFEIKSPVGKVAKKHLERYQARGHPRMHPMTAMVKISRLVQCNRNSQAAYVIK